MTERLYYQQPDLRSFDALVTRVLDRDGRPAVLLDRTAFYPTSGGQPFDTGRLGEVDVIETIDEDEEIVHVLSAPIMERAAVRGGTRSNGSELQAETRSTFRTAPSAGFGAPFTSRAASCGSR